MITLLSAPLIIGVALALVAPFAFHFLEQTNSSFTDYEEMQKSGIFEAGWLPSFLPKSSRDIHESHNIDTNHVEASFVYEVGDTASIESNCALLTEDDGVATYTCGVFEITLSTNGIGTIRTKYR